MKFLILLLTSGKRELLKRGIESIENQEMKDFDHTIKIVVNTLNNKYYEDLKNDKSIKYEIIRTESNGKPGKGHNSLIYDVFKKETDYDYLIPIDGDDLLYPCAFEQINKIVQDKPDIVHTFINDFITNEEKSSFHVKLKYNYKLITTIEQKNFLKEKRYIQQIGDFRNKKIFHCTTPSRIILLSRNIFNVDKPLMYGEDLTLYDDYIPFINILYYHKYQKNIKTLMLSDTNIYFYDKTNEDSASHNFSKMKEEDVMFREHLKKFPLDIDINIVSELPYKNITVPNNFTMNDKIDFCDKIINEDIIRQVNRSKNDSEKSFMFLEKTNYYDRDLLLNVVRNNKNNEVIYKYGKILTSLFPQEDILKELLDIYEKNDLFIPCEKIKKLLHFYFPDKYEKCENTEEITKGKKILCYYVGEAPPFNGQNYQEKNVWGSEIAAVKLCEELGEEYEVYIINNTDKEIKHNNVNYIHYNTFHLLLRSYQVDKLIISRYTHSFLFYDFSNVKDIYFILHDTRCHESVFGNVLPNLGIDLFLNHMNKIKKVICVSKWQKENMLLAFKHLKYDISVIEEKIEIIPNGINLNMFNNVDLEKKDKLRFIYHSNPNRGLLKLCEIMLELKKYYDIKLDIYFDSIKDENINKIIKENNFINFHGKLPNDKICEELKKTSIWLYPNVNSHETFCIAGLEAMASGNVLMSLNYSGIGELTNEVGFTFNHSDDNSIYVEKLRNLIENEQMRIYHQKKSLEYSKNFSWKKISKRFIEMMS